MIRLSKNPIFVGQMHVAPSTSYPLRLVHGMSPMIAACVLIVAVHVLSLVRDLVLMVIASPVTAGSIPYYCCSLTIADDFCVLASPIIHHH